MLRRLFTNTYIRCAVALVLIFFVLHLADVDDEIWTAANDVRVSEEVKGESVWLPNYKVEVEGGKIPGVTENASGITYDHDRETLWVVVNNPPYLVELDLEFKLLRRISLPNFEDTESVSYAGDGVFLITDERDQTVTRAVIESGTKRLDKKHLQQIGLNIHRQGNKGLEGIAVDSASNAIFTVRERDPMELFKITGFIEKENRIDVSQSQKIRVNSLYVDDLSGLHFDARSKHLLFLSDESKLVAEVDLEGNRVSYLDLERGFNGLSHTIPQPEGVTMDAEGRLYIVSEPNLLYRYGSNLSRD